MKDEEELKDLSEGQKPEPSGGQSVPGTPARRGFSRPVALALICAVLLVALAAGVGGYFYGRTTGEDLVAAKAAGLTAGKKQGAKRGAAKGLAIGLREGRRKGFSRAYGPAFRQEYAAAFGDAGLSVPDSKDIKVPRQ
ncbi:MAG: hypothetical protein IPK93_05135 [Solirubrobacterales bacterium]|nr:hypothetical protein [Solirubrobacterales bacterium]